MKKRRILAFVLTVVSVLSLVACQPNDQPKAPNGDDSVETNIVPLDRSDAVKVNLYTIIIPEDASDRLKEANDLLYHAIQEKCGVSISSIDDFLRKGEELPADAAEIVVGKTNRKDFSTLRYSDYSIRREGKRIYICGGSAASTKTAVEIFISKYLSKSGMLVPDGGYYNFSDEYSLEKVTVEGTDIKSFQIYAENKSDAHIIQDLFGSIIGWELPVAEKKAIGQNYIEMDDSFGNTYGFEIKIGSGSLTICCNKYTASEAIDYLGSSLFTPASGKEVNITAKESVKIYFDQKQENMGDEEVTVQIRAEATQVKLNQDAMNNSLVSRGDRTRLANVLRKAQKGEPVTVALIGGSITQGVGASEKEKSYAGLLRKWWENEFPSSALTFVNAGIGATDSIMGVHRVDTDVLKYEPDLVIVEFSANDIGQEDELVQEVYESLVRKILRADNSPAVMLLYFCNRAGSTKQNIHAEVGFNYNLPMISYKDVIFPSDSSKIYEWTEISDDAIHPNDKGHKVASELIINYIQNVESNLSIIDSKVESELASPITNASFDYCELLTTENTTPVSLGSFINNTAQYYPFKKGWINNLGAEPITFELKNVSAIYLLYYVDKSCDSGTVDIYINGGRVTTLNADDPDTWGDHAWVKCVLPDQGKNFDCTLSIEMQSIYKNMTFKLFGVMVSHKPVEVK